MVQTIWLPHQNHHQSLKNVLQRWNLTSGSDRDPDSDVDVTPEALNENQDGLH